MNNKQIKTLIGLRAAVGFLGEATNAGWWKSAFFTGVSTSFLNPVFSKTTLLAQMTGVTRAASNAHDERIGVGRVYHLFRLPENLEQQIFYSLRSGDLDKQIEALIAEKDAALSYLTIEQRPRDELEGGPVNLGSIDLVNKDGFWHMMAARYAQGINRKVEVYPYLTEKSSKT